jgi:hypothetical protein
MIYKSRRRSMNSLGERDYESTARMSVVNANNNNQYRATLRYSDPASTAQ